MDPLHLCIALGPLGVYLLLLGFINLLPRPFLTSGSRDAAALGIALGGLIVAGPMELFMPEAAAVELRYFVWPLLLAVYALAVTLLILMLRPRLVIYNITHEQLHPVLAEVAGQLDTDARWSGDTVALPKLHVQLCVEAHRGMRNVQLVSVGPSQSFRGWRRLEAALGDALAEVRGASNPYGISFVGFALLVLGMVLFWLAVDRDAVVQAWQEMMRL
jgi:uncharacterized membrane protein